MKTLAVIVTFGLAGLATVGALAAEPTATPRAQATVVTVSLYDFGMRLSRQSVPTGTVVFRVVNTGKVAHSFSAGGRTTATLRPGQRTTLTAQFGKAGRVTVACATRGHARKGMTRALTVVAPPSQQTVVAVSMFEMGFELSRTSVPPGRVEFRVVNDGKLPHDFRISGKGTPMLGAGDRATLIVELSQPGSYTFVCTVEGHAGAGMVGKLVVK